MKLYIKIIITFLTFMLLGFIYLTISLYNTPHNLIAMLIPTFLTGLLIAVIYTENKTNN